MEESEKRSVDAIRRMTDDLKEAYAARDLEKFVNFFAEDTVCMPHGELPIVGRAAWRSWLQAWWDEDNVDWMDLSTDEIVVAGDWAYERHHEETVTTPRAGGDASSSHFKGVWLLRRDGDDAWRIARYIWNANPAPEVSTRG